MKFDSFKALVCLYSWNDDWIKEIQKKIKEEEEE